MLSPCCPSASGLLGNLTDFIPQPCPRRGSRQPHPLVLGLGAPASGPLIPSEYLLDARRVNRLHGLVDPEKWPTPCKRRVALAKTVGTVEEGKGRGESEGSGEKGRKREYKREAEKEEGVMERERERNASFSLEKHFKFTKHCHIQHHLPAGTESIKPILQMSRLGLKTPQEVVQLRLQSKPTFLPTNAAS